MRRGEKNYKTYRTAPQLYMPWSAAVTYMLQGPMNVVKSCRLRSMRDTGIYLKIEDSVLLYRSVCWDDNHIFPSDHWAQAGIRDFGNYVRFDAVEALSNPSALYVEPIEPIEPGRFVSREELDFLMAKVDRILAKKAPRKRKESKV